MKKKVLLLFVAIVSLLAISGIEAYSTDGWGAILRCKQTGQDRCSAVCRLCGKSYVVKYDIRGPGRVWCCGNCGGDDFDPEFEGDPEFEAE